MSTALRNSAPIDPLIRLSGVSVTYPGSATQALSNVDFSLEPHQAVLVIGPSGSGKSTLAMVVAGLIPQSVEASVVGQIERSAELNHPGAIGFVFQDPESQFCQLTVGQEVAFGLENIATDPQLMDQKIGRALGTAGLFIDPGAPNYALSGGMQQKLALAAGLAPEPQLLIFDEPTANLDPQSTSQVFSQIESLIGEQRTILVVEHKFEHLLDLLPHLLIFDHHGRIHRSGDTSTVIAEEWSWLIAQGLVPRRMRAGFDPSSLPPPVSPHPRGQEDNIILSAESVSFSYVPPRLQKRLVRQGERPNMAIEDISLTINAKEMVAIVGPNGSGKSTLLSVLAGIRTPTMGQVHRPSSRTDVPVPIAFGFQNPEHQFIFERVGDELANRYVEGAIPDDVNALLQKFSLQGLESQSPFGLSQGQKRRLSVAVMIRDPHDAYLLDEPTFGQDQRTERQIMEALQALQTAGKAVVITTHDMDLVWQYATRVIVLVAGRITFDGPPTALFADSERMATANLLVHRDHAPDDTRQVATGQPRFIQVDRRQAESPLGRLNPGWKLITTITAMGLAMMASRVWQGALLALLPTLLLFFGARLSVGQVVKRMLPFVGFFAAYTWTLTAYSRVAPGTPTFHLLWFVLSWTGFHNGLVLAFRMLASVTFGVLYVSTTDVSQLVVSLTQNFHIPPRFSYGSLAGIRVFPLFEEEWRKIRQARMLRGKDVRRARITRVVTYALPLLTQAIRIGERVAVAMESRGFRGRASLNPKARTYYLDTPVRFSDFLYLGMIIVISLAIVLSH